MAAFPQAGRIAREGKEVRDEQAGAHQYGCFPANCQIGNVRVCGRMQEEGAPIWPLSLKLITEPQDGSMEGDMEWNGMGCYASSSPFAGQAFGQVYLELGQTHFFCDTEIFFFSNAALIMTIVAVVSNK